MTGFKSIIGQEQPIRFLKTLLEQAMIPNALLFAGPEGVGKRSTAHAFAMASNCRKGGKSNQKAIARTSDLDSDSNPKGFPTEPCGTCRSCRKFISGNHPDLILINPEGQTTKIALIRELRQTLTMKPYEARLRVVIIGEAHTLNPEASNALLKVLEEPPEHTVFILVTPYTYDLLPTILSRCQLVRFSPVPESLLADAFMKDHKATQEEAGVLAAMSGGSFSKVFALKNGDWLVFRNWIIEEIKTLHSGSTLIAMALAENLTKSKKKESVRDALEIVKTWLRDLVIAAYTPDKIVNKDLAEDIVNFSRQFPQQWLMKQVSAIDRAQRDIDANANPRLVLENLFLNLIENKPEVRKIL